MAKAANEVDIGGGNCLEKKTARLSEPFVFISSFLIQKSAANQQLNLFGLALPRLSLSSLFLAFWTRDYLWTHL